MSSSITPDFKRWFGASAPAGEALRLVCFPYAGGGGHIYADWRDRLSAQLGDQIGVYAVQLPGRGRRFSEPPLESVDAIASQVAEALAALDDKPVALFGHSMGALLAFETARQLRRLGRREPVRLLASAYGAPQVERKARPLHALPEPEFVAKLRELEGTPPEVFANKEIMELMMPVVRADFKVVETYRYREEAPLSIPISLFGGLQDTHFGGNELEAWQVQTLAGFTHAKLDGGHFFLHTHKDALLLRVGEVLEKDLSKIAF